MENMINFGIDLGTTNSAIAKFVNGEVIVYSNPSDYGRNTLPSVVGFKKDTVLVGSKAKEWLQRKPNDTVGRFKRRMGTTETYKIDVLKQSKSPIELSAYVLKELKNFVQTGEPLESVVITIPASFDTIQSNATKEAGLQAGFKEVVLLQEPIAASLAYANKKKSQPMKEGQWLVYDLGGGTFDVALVSIQNDEMKIIDHEGDNFLGGMDFDNLIVQKNIIPKLEELGDFENLEQDTLNGKNKIYYTSLHKAEEAKISLSSKTSADIDFGASPIMDDAEQEIDACFAVTRSEFEEWIKPFVDKTIDMVKTILTRNSLIPKDLQFVLMVGGSTFIPYVRKRVEEMLGIPVNCDIDPTTAVAIGAAYYAGTKPKELNKAQSKTNAKVALKVKSAYQKTSKEKEEFFAAKIDGDITGLFYRITREDGGFDTGLKPLTAKISEELPLVENAFNFFKLSITDAKNNPIATDAEPIGINSGYGISGQPLPHDICLEIDDLENNCSKSELIFAKNSILPLTNKNKPITKSFNRTLVKGSTDAPFRVHILEGSQYALPEANQTIGCIEIAGNQIVRDIAKGSDIEIVVEISESRDVKVVAYLTMTDQEFTGIFKPTERAISAKNLAAQTNALAQKLEQELEEATQIEDFETAKQLQALKKPVAELQNTVNELSEENVTDSKFQLDDRKRKLAQAIDDATKNKKLQAAKSEYFEKKQECANMVEQFGNDQEQKLLADVIGRENAFLQSSRQKIEAETSTLHSLMLQILWRTPDFLVGIFKDLLQNHRVRMNDQQQATLLIEKGMGAIKESNWDTLQNINQRLIQLLPKETGGKGYVPPIGFS